MRFIARQEHFRYLLPKTISGVRPDQTPATATPRVIRSWSTIPSVTAGYSPILPLRSTSMVIPFRLTTNALRYRKRVTLFQGDGGSILSAWTPAGQASPLLER